MRTWFWTLLLAVVAVALAVVLRSHSGNVLLLVWPWRIEMSLTLAVLLIVAAFVVLYVGLRVLAWLLAIPDRVRVWRGKRAQARDHELLERGWISLLEGRYSQAEKDLTRLLDQTKVQTRRVLAALSSARAARRASSIAVIASWPAPRNTPARTPACWKPPPPCPPTCCWTKAAPSARWPCWRRWPTAAPATCTPCACCCACMRR